MLALILAIIVLCVTAVVFLSASNKPTVALDAKNFQKFELIKRTEISHDTLVFRFGLHKPDQTLGLPIGQHIVIRAKVKDAEGVEKDVQHSYTPISSDDEKGYVDFLIKVYLPCERFPQGGRLTQHIFNMQIGDQIEMRGPQGKFTYRGNGNFDVATSATEKIERHVDAFAMVAGGSGITPMMQIIRAIEKNPNDRTQCYLVFGNQTENDILLREELDTLVARDSRFHVWYSVDRDFSPSWKFSTGYVCEEMLLDHVPVPTKFGTDEIKQNKGIRSAVGLMCGPPPMIKFAVKPNLLKIGYGESDLFSF